MWSDLWIGDSYILFMNFELCLYEATFFTCIVLYNALFVQNIYIYKYIKHMGKQS